jgi:hypothetical protein
MKTYKIGLLAGLGVFSLFLAKPAAAQIQVGTGNDHSFLVIEAADFGATMVFQWNYTHNPSSPFKTADMLAAVDVVQMDLNFTILYGGTFLDAIEYKGNTLTNSFLPPYSPFWAQWVSGGTSGAPLETKPLGIWSAGFGIANRELAPGSWDGLIFNGVYDSNPPYDVISAIPSVAPVPEPHVLWLLIAGGVIILLRRQGRFAR